MFNAKFKSLLNPGEKVTAEQLEAEQQMVGFELAVNNLSRRRFAGGLTGAIALVVGGGFIKTPKGFAQTPATPAVSDVLNFALNLEYLEANLYSIVTTGNPISTSLQGSAPGAIAGSPGKLTLDATTMALYQALLNDEMNHINDLRTAITGLGATPISQPAINYAAKGAITTQAQLLATTRQFTALGNSAYTGAAQFLVSNIPVLLTAAQILGAEGQHLGAVNYQCISQNVTASFSTNAMAFIDPMDTPPSPTQYFTVFTAANSSSTQPIGLAPATTTGQDLSVVYGQATGTSFPSSVTPGGFFPNGVNGAIQS